MTEWSLIVESDTRIDESMITNPEVRDAIAEPFVAAVLQAAAKHMEVSGEVSVSFVTDEEIHELNRDYRDVDRPTDVLSFALQEGEDFPQPDDGTGAMWGDIVVSVPTALRQASEYGHSIKREIGFLLVHGFLHLLGYDHQTPEEETEMLQIQEEVLEGIGLSRTMESR